METIDDLKDNNVVTPKDVTPFERPWFSWEIYVGKDAKKWFTMLRINVHGKHPLKKMVGDTTRTYYVESGSGEFIIDGIKNKAIPGHFFIIEPWHQYEYSGDMILIENNISQSNSFNDELIDLLEKK